MRLVIAAGMLLIAAQSDARFGENGIEPIEPIIVTGIRIQDYRDRLAACLARNCPPDEDIAATLALAEALFLEGEYGEARNVAWASIGRNRGHAAQYPEPVSGLYRAHSRLSRHLGFDREALRSANEVLDSLQAGIPEEDFRHFTARFELAAMQMASGRYNAAQRELDRIARRARDSGRDDVAVMAELRSLLYEDVALPNGPARARLIQLSRQTDPERRLETTGAKALLARIYIGEGERERAAELLAEIGAGTSAQRRLIFAPRYQLLGANAEGDGLLRWSENFEGKWIDVGFWVMPDGRVAELEVMRSGGETVWARPLLESIRGRVYSTAEEPTYRLERYTLTARREQPTGSHIQRQMSDMARVEYLDLTLPEAPAGDPPTP